MIVDETHMDYFDNYVYSDYYDNVYPSNSESISEWLCTKCGHKIDYVLGRVIECENCGHSVIIVSEERQRQAEQQNAVYPDRIKGGSMAVFGIPPKYTITCGKCSYTFKKRIPLIDCPGIMCPNCKAINKLPIGITNYTNEGEK